MEDVVHGGRRVGAGRRRGRAAVAQGAAAAPALETCRRSNRQAVLEHLLLVRLMLWCQLLRNEKIRIVSFPKIKKKKGQSYEENCCESLKPGTGTL